MIIETMTIWERFSREIYFFILKRVKNSDVSEEILQNSFLKIHQNVGQLKNSEKVKAWTFQIVRNEISNHFNNQRGTHQIFNSDLLQDSEANIEFCCLERFISSLPQDYKEVIEMVYMKGKKQSEVAELIGISLANVKSRIRRAKSILKTNFNECCKFELNEDGKLIGEPNCAHCD